MRFTQRLFAAALTLIIGAASMIPAATAKADRNGSKTAAIALGATSLALLATQRNKTPGIIAGVGALIAYSESNKSRDCDRDNYYVQYRKDDGCNDRYNYRTTTYYDRDRVNYYRYDHNYDRDRDRHDGDRHDNRHDRDDNRDGHHNRR